jgi:hypothetical protein
MPTNGIVLETKDVLEDQSMETFPQLRQDDFHILAVQALSYALDVRIQSLHNFAACLEQLQEKR